MKTQLCPHGCGHRIRAGHQHARANCPPPAGKHGDRYQSLFAKRAKPIISLTYDVRGASVAGVGGNQAKSHRTGKKKAAKTGEVKA